MGTGLPNTGEVTGRRARAEWPGEGIDLIAGLWAGRRPFAGRHYRMDLEARADLGQVAVPVQRPRIPIWVVGAWPRPRSMRRVLRCDGLLPAVMEPGGGFRETRPDDVRPMLAWLDGHGGVRPGFDVVIEGETPARDPVEAVARVAPMAEAGCTWWLETRWQLPHHSPERRREVRKRLEAGPPRG